MDKLANTITDFYIQKSYVPEDKREIYSYGFKLIIADIINFTMVVLLGLILGHFFESVVFLITLCGVRQFSGGFHAKTFWLCRLSMIITFLCVLGVSPLISANTDHIFTVIGILDITSVVFIAVFAPVKHPDKILTNQQQRRNKIKAIIISFILSTISIALILAHRNEGVTISITLVAITILMVIGIIEQKGEDDDD